MHSLRKNILQLPGVNRKKAGLKRVRKPKKTHSSLLNRFIVDIKAVFFHLTPGICIVVVRGRWGGVKVADFLKAVQAGPETHYVRF